MMRPMMPKVYLGDAVYAQFAEGYLKLTVEYGHGPEETIFLDGKTLVGLERYITLIKESNTNGREAYTPNQTDNQADGSKL